MSGGRRSNRRQPKGSPFQVTHGVYPEATVKAERTRIR